MSTPHHEIELRVRYAECDMQGRVFNSNYLTWIDMASAETLAQIAGSSTKLMASGIDYVVAAAELRYHRAATFNDRIVVHTSLVRLGTTSLHSKYTISRNDELLADCKMVHVCVDSTTFIKRPWPQWLRDRLAD